MRLESVFGHLVYAPPLGPRSVVVDCGANHGRFALSAAERFGCLVTAVEADPVLFAALPADPRVTYFHRAVCGNCGPVTFRRSANHDAGTVEAAPIRGAVLEEVSVPAVTLGGLFASAGADRIDLLKLDIEGAEIGLLDAATDNELRRVGQITAEFHDHWGMTPRAEVERVADRLRRLGFRLLYDSWRLSYIDALFVHRSLLGGLTYRWLMGPRRAARGVARRLTRSTDD